MNIAEAKKKQAEAISKLFLGIDDKAIEQLTDAVVSAKRVYAAGFGRAGNVAGIFAMNCSQAGILSFRVGDNGTPAITSDDILVICSGSGNTKTISLMAQQAKDHGATLALISTNADSTMGKIADINVVVPLAAELEKMGAISEQDKNLLADVFYEVAFALNDFIRAYVMDKLGLTTETLSKNHNNLE